MIVGVRSSDGLRDVRNLTEARLQNRRDTCGLYAVASLLDDVIPAGMAVDLSEVRGWIRANRVAGRGSGLTSYELTILAERNLPADAAVLIERVVMEGRLLDLLARGQVIAHVDGDHWVRVLGPVDEGGITWVRIYDPARGAYEQLLVSFLIRAGENQMIWKHVRSMRALPGRQADRRRVRRPLRQEGMEAMSDETTWGQDMEREIEAAPDRDAKMAVLLRYMDHDSAHDTLRIMLSEASGDLIDLPAGRLPAHPGSVERCYKLARFLHKGRVTFEEYAHNVTLHFISALDSDIPRCIESIPPEFADAYSDYLRAFLEPVDFMPDPGPFMVNTNDLGIEESLKRRLRPRYLRLYQVVCWDRASIAPAAIATSPEQP